MFKKLHLPYLSLSDQSNILRKTEVLGRSSGFLVARSMARASSLSVSRRATSFPLESCTRMKLYSEFATQCCLEFWTFWISPIRFDLILVFIICYSSFLSHLDSPFIIPIRINTRHIKPINPRKQLIHINTLSLLPLHTHPKRLNGTIFFTPF